MTMQAASRTLVAGSLLVALAMAGCVFPWQVQQSTDGDSNYGGGPGMSITVVNHGNQTFDVKVVGYGGDHKMVGESNFTLKPGQSATRKFATPVQGTLSATLQYHFTGGGSASTGLDTQSLPEQGCGTLRAGEWTLTNVERTAGSQWHDNGCVT